ncbi:hypothetical protein BLL41_15085 [Bacillus sp. FMQ74]|nr:hypothetical protein BLL41_15085 [Bacillus sp. FMQ74]
MLVTNIITPSGSAEYSPAMPTSGEVTEPNKNGMTPRNAEALPAMCPCDSKANVMEEGPMTSADAIKKKRND